MNDVLQKQCDYVGRQVLAAVDGLPAEAWDTRVTDRSMSPRETIVHLCDVYQHVAAMARGQEAKWNQYAPSDSGPKVVVADFTTMRKEAIKTCLASDNAYELVTDYIVVHDAYHVGQLCTARMSAEPNWDPYAIYR